MTTTAEESIAQRQAEGERQYGDLRAYVTGAESRTATAYEVEERIFRSVLAMGQTLLQLFFESRAAARPAGPVRGADGTELAYHDRRSVMYRSVFGKVVFRRHAFWGPGQGVVCPLDAELSLPGAVLLGPAAGVEWVRECRRDVQRGQRVPAADPGGVVGRAGPGDDRARGRG